MKFLQCRHLALSLLGRPQAGRPSGMSSALGSYPARCTDSMRLQSTGASDISIHNVRNIGIMAHIDAGKTTTTERMLFYSGVTNHLGDVDDGDTVMDFMEQERARGITITSAAITFPWQQYCLNLIDTPGHVDFTLEVERSLRVLDGAIAVLDGSAGVEAQTLTVWRQADNYNIPRIVYINKMDKFGANFDKSVSSVKDKLQITPLLIQKPIGKEKSFSGILDIVTMEKIQWDPRVPSGRKYQRIPLDSKTGGSLYEEVFVTRTDLVEDLAEMDEGMADVFLSEADPGHICPSILQHSLRRVTLAGQAVPVLCGSSLRNMGVQPLMDAVGLYLPDPTQIHHSFVEYYKDHLCGLAFKIMHDKRRGPLTFIRLYTGTITAGSPVYNINRDCTERISRLLQVYADDMKDIAQAEAGHIVAVAGFKETITGDTVVSSSQVAKAAEKQFQKTATPNEDGDIRAPVLAGLTVPDPVFFCSIEPPSMAYKKQLDHALACLTKEDPSLKVHFDEDTGETIVSGMGELHLDIIQDRIRKEYKVDTHLGQLQISYKEMIGTSVERTVFMDTTIGETRHQVTVCLSVHPSVEEHGILEEAPHENTSLAERPKLPKPRLKAIKNGVTSALTRGPILRSPLLNVKVKLHEFRASSKTSLSMMTAAVAQCIQDAMKDAQPSLLEPMMSLQIHVEDELLGTVISDLSQRRAQISDISHVSDHRVVNALVPLSEMVGYATTLRTLTHGTATFSMHVAAYEAMSKLDEAKAIERMTGLRPR